MGPWALGDVVSPRESLTLNGNASERRGIECVVAEGSYVAGINGQDRNSIAPLINQQLILFAQVDWCAEKCI
jgi:hypothetical protein